MKSFPFSFITLDFISYHVHLNPKKGQSISLLTASEVLKHNLLILVGLPSHNFAVEHSISVLSLSDYVNKKKIIGTV